MDMTNLGGLTNKNKKLRINYEENKKRCINCDKDIPYEKRYNTFCSASCSATYMQKDGGNNKWSEKKRNKLSQKMKRLFAEGKITLPPKESKIQAAPKIKIECAECKQQFEVYPSNIQQKCCSRDCAKKNGSLGGYRQKSGRGKSGWYKGYFCSSSWELAWVIYSLDHEIKFERNTKGFEYKFESEIHKYYPDFKLEDGSYMEIKGYDSAQWTSKQSQFKGILHVLGKNEIKSYIEYAKSIYGDDYVKMYESK